MNRNFIFLSLTVAVGVNLSIIGCHRKGDAEAAGTKQMQQTASLDSVPVSSDSLKNAEPDVMEVRTYQNSGPIGGFGYDIYRNGEPAVHQEHIPAVPGKKGFANEEAARRTGEYVAYKIQNKIWPPSVSIHELDSLGVLKK